MHDSVTANKNQYKKLKMEKHSWPVKATSQCIEGYALPGDPYKDPSHFLTLTRLGAKKGSIACMASFGTLEVCLECIQKLLADADQKFGYTAEIEIYVCRVEKDTTVVGVTHPSKGMSELQEKRQNQVLNLRMCMHNDAVKLTFTYHWEMTGATSSDPVTNHMQTLDECVVPVDQLAKMTYLSPQISVPVNIQSDAEFQKDNPLSSLYQRKQKRSTGDQQAVITFLGPVTLTYAAGLTAGLAELRKQTPAPPALEYYYVSSMKSYKITAETQPLKLMDGMDSLLPVPATDQNPAHDVSRAEHDKMQQVIEFDERINIWMTEMKDQNEETEKQAFLALESVPTGTTKVDGKYVIPHGTPKTQKQDGVVFYDEIHQRMIPRCSHWLPQAGS